MNRAISIVRLDFCTVKPYFTFKNAIIFIIVAVIMIFSIESYFAAMGFIMVFGALYVSYPFAVGEKNGIDSLYVALGFKRKTIVTGRYLFTFVIDILSAIISYIIALLFAYALGKEFDYKICLITAVVFFGAYSLIQMFQIPIYFKLGYARAKMIAYIPLIGWPLVIMGLSKFGGDSNALTNVAEWATNNQAAAIALLVLFWMACFYISLSVSKKYYNKRDF